MLRCDAACSALPQALPSLRLAARRAAPPPPRFARSAAARLRVASRSRASFEPPRAAADDDAAAASSPPPPSPDAPLWAVPWDDGVTATVCARFAFVWFVGFAGPSLVQQLAGSPLLPDARAEAQLALELLKAAATYQLLSSRLAPFAPLPPPWFACRLEARALALGAAGAVAAAAVAVAVAAVFESAAAPADAGAGVAFFAELLAQSDAGLLGAGALSACALTLLVSPPLEEAFFRGFLLPVLAHSMPPAAAVAASAAVFAAGHLAPPLGTAQLFAVGAVLGATTLAARGNLAAPIVAHAGYNALTITIAALTAAASQGGS